MPVRILESCTRDEVAPYGGKIGFIKKCDELNDRWVVRMEEAWKRITVRRDEFKVVFNDQAHYQVQTAKADEPVTGPATNTLSHRTIRGTKHLTAGSAQSSSSGPDT